MSSFWETTPAGRGALLAALTSLLALRALLTACREREAGPRAAPASALGLADWLTLARGLVICLLASFFFSPRPAGAWAWIQGSVFLAVVAGDGLDGHLARRLGGPSAFGAALDREIDALGTAVSASLAFQYGKVPGFYLPVAGLYYVFQAGLWLYRKGGGSVSALPDSRGRKTIGALNAIFLALVLWPVFEPPATFAGATIFLILVCASFLKDWLAVTGRPKSARPG